MTTYQFNVIFKGPSGLAKDQFVNSWHFYHATGAPVTDYDNVRDMLKDFYCTAPAGGELRLHMTADLNPIVRVVAYNLDEAKPRAPVYDSTFTVSAFGSGTPLPYEVALCFSFEAAKSSGEIQARRRNRVYLGPFRSNVCTSLGQVLPTVCTNVLDAGKRLKSASDSSATWDWKVYSPTEDEVYDPQHLWCDNAFDTQRRRGTLPTTRTQFSY